MQDTQELVQEGQGAPDFKLASNKGSVNLAAFRGQQNVVLYFMREFSCMICRGHVRELSKLYSELQQHNTEVVVIGGGSQQDAQRLTDTYKLPFIVAGDTDRTVYHRYGLDKAIGVLQRSGSIVVDKSGTVRYVQRSTMPTSSLDKTELLNAVNSL